MIDCFKIRSLSAGDHAFREGDFCKNRIMFVIEGDYQLGKNQQKRILYGSECVSENRMATFKSDCTFRTDGKIAETKI